MAERDEPLAGSGHLEPDPTRGRSGNIPGHAGTAPSGRSLAAGRDVVGAAVGVAVCFDGSAVSARPEVARSTATAIATAVLAIAMPRRAVIHLTSRRAGRRGPRDASLPCACG